MSAAIRLEVAREQVAKMSSETLASYAKDGDGIWRLSERVGVAAQKLYALIRRERFNRGDLKLTDVTPDVRRQLIDEANADLHALAAGPIMDAANLYCPLGKLSMAETRAREASQVERLA